MVKYKLGDICEIVSGSTPKTDIEEYWNGDIKWITPAELDDESYIVSDTSRKITELAVKKTGLSSLPEGTVILSSRAPIGKVAIAGCEMYCNQGFKNLICSEKIYNRYLFWFLKGNTEYLNSLGRGATFKEISKKIVSDIEINVPEMNQQKKAVLNIEQLSKIIGLRKSEIDKLDALIRARFVEMFGNPVRNSKNWNTEKLCSIAPINKYNGDIDTVNGKVWLLNLDMIESCTGNIVDFLYEFENRITSSTIKFDENCVLYSKLRPYLNKVVIPERKGYATSELVSMSTEKINKYFLANLLRQDSFVNFSNATAYGAKMPRASMDLIKNFDVINPPTELQNQFGKLVIEVEKSKFEVQKALDKAQLLFDSLMQKYFG